MQLFDLTPEQRETAEALVKYMAAGGITLTVDEAQLMANLGTIAEHIIDENPRTLGTKFARVLAGNSPRAQACLAVIAQHVIKQHTLTYDDVNLRALSTMSMLIGVLAALTNGPGKPKHVTGG